MKKKILISFGAVAILVIIIGSIFYLNFKKRDSNSSSTNSISVTREVSKSPNQFEITGWIPDWGTTEGIESLKINKNILTSVSPVWFEVNTNGSLINKTPKKSSEIVSLGKSNQIPILPSIACFDHEILTLVLQNQENLDRHVTEIFNQVIQNNFDGIDIDYESTKLSDKDKFFEFLAKLSSKLHSRDKKLSVSVLAKWGDEIEYSSLKETRKVQDYSEIAKYADEIRIMTYDYFGTKSQFPGPIGPLNWQEDVLKYAVTKADKSKFLLGVHLYSYEHYAEVKDPLTNLNFKQPNLQFETDYKKQGFNEIGSRSYTYNTVKDILKNYSGKNEDYEGEKIYKYSKINDDTKILENRVLVYIDSLGVQARIDLAKKYGLKGIAFWKLGGEEDLISGLKT